MRMQPYVARRPLLLPCGHRGFAVRALGKLGDGVVAAAASSAEPNAVMLLSLSIVNVVIIVLLGATLCAVMTWITPKRLKGKAIVQGIAQGDGTAMVLRAGGQMITGENR